MESVLTLLNTGTELCLNNLSSDDNCYIYEDNSFRIIQYSGLLRHVHLVRMGVSEERVASIFRMTRIGELGTTSAVSSNEESCILHCHRSENLKSYIVYTSWAL
jgi:hypothetical protein